MSKVAVIGLGRLGLEIANVMAEHNTVIGIDNNEERVKLATTFPAATDLNRAKGADFIFIVVNTSHHLNYLSTLLQDLARIGEDHAVPVINSTLQPGTTYVMNMRFKGDLASFVYNPVFVRQGNVRDDVLHPPMLLIGAGDQESRQRVADLWKPIVGESVKVILTDPITAEIAKLALNSWLCTKIHFGNIIGDLCRKLGADNEGVLQALSADHRINISYMKPGMGFGGPCLPVDLMSFNLYAQDPVLETLYMANATRAKNLAYYLVASRSKCVAVLGLTYKMGVSITEESAGMALANELNSLGIDVRYHDPSFGSETIDAIIDDADTVVIALPYPEYVEKDYGKRRVIDPWRARKP